MISSRFRFRVGLIAVVVLVAGSASWRIPLALQFLPGISLCLGCFILPPSPRLLVLRGRMHDALQTLAKLRLRTPDEAKEDPLIQVFFFPSPYLYPEPEVS